MKLSKEQRDNAITRSKAANKRRATQPHKPSDFFDWDRAITGLQAMLTHLDETKDEPR